MLTILEKTIIESYLKTYQASFSYKKRILFL